MEEDCRRVERIRMAGRLSAYGHSMGKLTHGWDGSIERRFDLLEEHEAIEICRK